MQILWQLKLNWDESLPESEHTKWFCQLKMHVEIQMHGFSDASQIAYGACVYLRVTDENGEHRANLLCSKGRVCPLKTLSIPRLELCGAVLLAKLVKSVMTSLDIQIDKCFY